MTQVEATNQLGEEALSILAHELKTPLASMFLHFELMKRLIAEEEDIKTHRKEKLSKLIGAVEQQLETFSEMVNNLFSMADVSTGKWVLKCDDVDLSHLVRKVVDCFEEELKLGQNSVDLHLAVPLVGKWDSLRIEQVIVNLLTNAMKYGAKRPITIITQMQGDRALLLVKDQGIGISEKDQKRIFGRFEQIQTQGRNQGLGLGLFITQQIVHSHGGTIRVESCLDQGATFVVDLPLARVI